MKRVVRIEDVRDDVLLDFVEVLQMLTPEAHDLRWSILDLGEAVAAEGERLAVLALENEVAGSPTGLKMTFGDLMRLAERFRQVIDGLFVGCAREEQLPRRADDDKVILERADMLIAAFDSSFWLLAAPDTVLARVRRKFAQVVDQHPDQVKLSAWER